VFESGDTIALPEGAVDAAAITDATISADKLSSSGTMPAWDGSALTGLVSPSDAHDSVYAATTPTSGGGGEGSLTETYNNGSSGVGATLTNDGEQAAFELDGMTTSVGDRILVKNQPGMMGGGNQNGIYTVTTVGDGSTNWVLTRATDADTPAKFSHGAHCFVDGGGVNEGTAWYYHTDDPTTPVDFENSDIQFRIFLGGVQSPYNSIEGDLLYFNGTKYVRLTAGGGGDKVLTMNSGETAPSWVAPAVTVGETTSIKHDISLLALQTAINGNLSAYGLKNSWIEQFENSTYIENLSTVDRVPAVVTLYILAINSSPAVTLSTVLRFSM
jgi:hypothetical protein